MLCVVGIVRNRFCCVCGNCVEMLMLCVDGIVANKFCCVLWEIWGKDSIVCCGNCREQILLCVGELY